ncbi:hypothetical protein CXB51_035630 [Gossypium anomalum]|uniref:Uncharacterized protein n=1 Tax=Gossypium anomalum TaxID=47600 RepID=A0A8J6CFS5_9ROSI|nr:hypothetical protein CXB51_035630 [Gossypium anomalum]
MMIDCSISKDSTLASLDSSSTSFNLISSLNSIKFLLPSCVSLITNDEAQSYPFFLPPIVDSNCRFAIYHLISAFNVRLGFEVQWKLGLSLSLLIPNIFFCNLGTVHHKFQRGKL